MASPVALAASWYQTPVTDFADMTDEIDHPVVCPAEGCVMPYPFRYGPTTYPGDDTGAAAAHELTDSTDPVLVLNTKTSLGGIDDHVLDVTALNLLYNFALDRDYTGVWSQWYALLGHWRDLNGDKYIQNDQWEYRDDLQGAAAYRVSLDPVSVTKRDTTFDADVEDEWEGMTGPEYKDGDASRELVLYNSGYGFQWTGPCGVGVNACGGTTEGVGPFSTFDPISENDGYHKTKILLCAGFCEGALDPSLLVTSIWETYVGKGGPRSYAGCDDRELYPDGCRTYTPVDGFPYDTDVHQQLDNDITTLYTSGLRAYRDQGEAFNQTQREKTREVNAHLNDTEEIFNQTWYGSVKPVLLGLGVPDFEAASNDTTAAGNQLRGGIDDINTPEFHDEICQNGGNCWADAYFETWHPYLDLTPLNGFTAPLPAFILKGGFGNNGLVAVGGQGLWTNPRRDGLAADDEWATAPGELYVTAQFGLWNDRNGDGFITDHQGANEDPAEGCDDKFNCGLAENPNDYEGPGTNRHHEWWGVCFPFTARVTPLTTGNVWPGGAYVIGSGVPGDNNDLSPAVNDVLDGDTNGDGSAVDRFVTAGPILVPMECDAADPGEHHPKLYIVLPQGSATFDIRLEVEDLIPEGGLGGTDGRGLCIQHSNGVIGTEGDLECTNDIDIQRRWIE